MKNINKNKKIIGIVVIIIIIGVAIGLGVGLASSKTNPYPNSVEVKDNNLKNSYEANGFQVVLEKSLAEKKVLKVLGGVFDNKICW